MTYPCIVVGTDFSNRAGRAVEAAAVFADRYQSERVHLAHVVPFSGFYDAIPPSYSAAEEAEVRRSAVEGADQELERVAGALAIDARVTREARLGRPGRDLAELARAARADLFIVTSHGRRALARTVLGSVASDLVRTAPCPVLVVRPEGPVLPEPREILAAVDLSDVSEAVLRHAVRLATPTGATVRALTLCEPPLWVVDHQAAAPGMLGQESLQGLVVNLAHALDELAARVRTDRVDVKTEVLRRGPPAETILEIAESVRPEMLVVGTSGRNAWHRFILGATASRVVAEAACPVMAVVSPDPVESY